MTKTIQEALKDLKWRKAIMEEMLALEKKNMGNCAEAK